MTVTTTLGPPTTLEVAPPRAIRQRLARTAATAGLVASVATTAIAAVARAVDISLQIAGKPIPLGAFAQLTIMGTIIGTVLAAVLSRRARQPRPTFVNTTIALTVLSIVPDLIVNAQVSSKLTLVLTHAVAAAIIIPALASRLTD